MNKTVSNIFNTSKIRPILLSVVIMSIFWIVAYFVKDVMTHGIKERDRTGLQKEDIIKKKTDNVNLMFAQFATILYYFIIFIGICTVLPMCGVESTTMFAIIGTVGLSLSLSSQNVLNNLWSGVVILFNDIYKIDDVIKYTHLSYSIRGRVKEFNLFYTKIAIIATGEEISFANSVLYGGAAVITNESIIYESS